MINRVFFGRLAVKPARLGVPVDTELPGVKWRDRVPALALVLLIFAFGLQPEWITRWMEPTTTTFTPIPEQTIVLTVAPVTAAPTADHSAIAISITDRLFYASAIAMTPSSAKQTKLAPIYSAADYVSSACWQERRYCPTRPKI